MKHKRGLFLFVSSCIPGCGQMYQGYMKRGLSIMLVFWGILGLALFVNISALVVLLIPVWLCSYFDSYNLRARGDADIHAVDDDFLFGFSDMDSEKFSTLCRKRHSLIGWGLVIIGVWMLYDRLVRRLLGQLVWQFEWLNWLYELMVYDVPRLVLTVGIIALGLWFIRGPKKAEDIPVFTPPAETAEQEAEHGEE